MHIGDRWTYQEELRGGNPKHPDTTQWEQQETTVALKTQPQGLLIQRQVAYLNGTAPPRFLRQLKGHYDMLLQPCAWPIEAGLSSGDNNYMWFEPRIGLTAERIFHNGTYNDFRVRLLHFAAAQNRSQ